MNLKKSKKYLLENTRKALAFVLVFSILFASGCTFGVPSGNDVPKDDYSNSHARIIEDNANSNIDNIDITKPEGTGEIDNENDPSQNAKIENDLGGFIIPTPGSFADRVQGLYKVEGEKDTYVEFYDIGDNIYGYYSGKQHGCIELFALDEEGFISTTSDSIEVQMVTFTEENNHSYLSEGIPAIVEMSIKDDGIEFSNYDTESGEMLFKDNTKLTKIEGELGHLDGFSYADKEESAETICNAYHINLTQNPEEIVGSWILLGDIVGAMMIEFTEEGYAQVYLKNTNRPVFLMRGTYATGKDKVNGGTNIYLSLHYTADDSYMQNNFCYVPKDDSLSMCVGNTDYGMDFSWEDALFIPYDMSSMPRQEHTKTSTEKPYADLKGLYISEDNYMVLLSGDGFYRVYDSIDLENATLLSEGSFESDPGGYILYGEDDDTEYGFIAFIQQDIFDLTFYDTNETKEFFLLIN